MVKAVTLFLIAMMVLAMFGKLRLPKIGKSAQKKCPKCGRFLIGSGPCDCSKRG